MYLYLVIRRQNSLSAKQIFVLFKLLIIKPPSSAVYEGVKFENVVKILLLLQLQNTLLPESVAMEDV